MTRLLGRGGMGEVWAAVGDSGQGGGHREVAIKILLARAAMKPDLVRRFEREAKITSAINSKFVCQLLEVSRAHDGAHLLVFEHLNGESLADRLKREQYLPFSEVGPIIEDVLQGLVAAHDAGVIHRDLKPGNIFLEQRREEEDVSYAPPSGGFGFGSTPPPPRRERAKILDFGISKLARREKEEPTLTAFDATLGSFAYMAPEQVRGAARADERADIYAVGAVAFRSLSGRLPFEGATAAVLVAMKLDRQAPSLAEVTGEHWPAGIERFLERALERRRELRFPTAREALEAWRSVQPSRMAMGSQPSLSAQTEPSPPSGEPTMALPLRARRSPSQPVTMGETPKPPARPAPASVPVPLVPFAARTPQGAAPRPGPGQGGYGGQGGNPMPLAPLRMKTPIPMPTKPLVAALRAQLPEPAATRTLGRHGTLTMDEAPDDLAYPAPVVMEPAQGSPAAMPVAIPGMPVPRPPMQSYQIIEDNPTEVDGPPEMTFDGSYNPMPAAPAPPDPRDARRGKTGRH